MGQYQQWLHYQEIDRQLRSELERLESELAHLQESMGVDAQEVEAAANGEIPQQSATISAHNTVIRLLALGMQGLPSTFSQQAGSGRNGFAHDIRAHTMGPVEEHGHVERAGSEGAASGKGRQAENGGILATPVMSQGWLPQSGPVEGTPFMERQTRAATPDSEMVLLPQDMQGFFDQHAQTDPQQEVPWWQHKQLRRRILPLLRRAPQMNENATDRIGQKELDELYASLKREDVEEFYASYSRWADRKS